jgi:hypothetical protein
MKLSKTQEIEQEGMTASDFDEFEDFDMDEEFQEEDGTKSIPFAQLVTTNVGLTRFAAMPDKDYPYGLFIPMSQAEKAGFTPDDNWIINYPVLGGVVRKFGGDDGSPGYFVKPDGVCRMVILAQSQQEVYKEVTFQGKKSKACLGLYLSGFDPDSKPIKTEAGRAFDEAEKNTGWQRSERYLFYVVGVDGQPLSERPFSLRISNAFGIGFKSEYRLMVAEMIAASKTHSEMNKAKAIALAETAKAEAVASGNVELAIERSDALKQAKRQPIRSLSRKDSARFVFEFSQSMRENKDGIGTTYLSGRAVPSIWKSGEKPAPSAVDRTKKNTGEVIYSVALTPTAYTQLFIKNTSTFGAQISADLETYKDYSVPPNMRKLLTESPASTVPMPDYDPSMDAPMEETVYEYEFEDDEPAVSTIESDDRFSSILVQLSKAVDADQISKWLAWAIKPTRMDKFIADYPDYESQLKALADRHAENIAF